MMKKFITAMLGSIAGFWISLTIIAISFFLFIAVAISNTSEQSVSLTDKSVLHLKLNGEISERERPLESIYDLQSYDKEAISYRDIIKAICAAKDDDKIEGIFIDCKGASIGLSSCQEIIEALNDFKKTSKWVYAYADNYGQGDYYIASASDSIFINPIGNVDIHGLSATTMFYKGLMDKIGVEAQVLKVGTYKSAVEPFMLTHMSDASREQQLHYMGNIWNSICTQIANSRKVTIDKINEWADSLIYTKKTDYYVKNKVVDKTYYRHEFETMLRNKLKLEEDEVINLISPKYYFAQNNVINLNRTTEHIAVLFATGDIVDNGNGGIVGDKMVPQILDLAKDDNVKGLVLRVNSGGGSAFASEQIWDALEQFKKEGKPFYVSMGDVAASGGYYISCGADQIYAEPTTLTGSIGIFGIIPNIKKQKYIENGYSTFVTRCANGRGVPVDSILKIAEGRVWDGKSAKEIGLIDKFGGLEKVIADMKEKTGVESVVDYPLNASSFLNEIMSSTQLSSSNFVPTEFKELKDYYDVVNRIKRMSNVQCKMEDITIK